MSREDGGNRLDTIQLQIQVSRAWQMLLQGCVIAREPRLPAFDVRRTLHDGLEKIELGLHWVHVQFTPGSSLGAAASLLLLSCFVNQPVQVTSRDIRLELPIPFVRLKVTCVRPRSFSRCRSVRMTTFPIVLLLLRQSAPFQSHSGPAPCDLCCVPNICPAPVTQAPRTSRTASSLSSRRANAPTCRSCSCPPQSCSSRFPLATAAEASSKRHGLESAPS